MKNNLQQTAFVLLVLSVAACASSPPNDGLSHIEVVFADSKPSRAFEAVGPVVTRHWNVEEGLQALRNEARKLGADAVVNVVYSEFESDADRKGQFDWSRRRVNESNSQVVFKFDGLAVRWRSDAAPIDQQSHAPSSSLS